MAKGARPTTRAEREAIKAKNKAARENSTTGEITVGQAITVGSYEIQRGTVKRSGWSSGIAITSESDFENLTNAQKAKYGEAIKKAGIKDPVYIEKSNAFVERAAVEAALKQRRDEEAAFKKNVPGYEKLWRAEAEDEKIVSAYRRSVERGNGRIEGKPTSAIAASVAKQYPVAAAYRRAESFKLSNNATKSALGREAMDKIASGKPYKKVIKDMEDAWTKSAMKHKFD